MAFVLAVLSFGHTSVHDAVTVYRKGENGYDTYRIPMIMAARDGRLLAFAEARKNSRSDSGDIDIVVKSSDDGGKSWSPAITVWDDGGNTCGNPSAVLDRESGRIILVATWNKGCDKEKDIHHLTSSDTRRVFSLYSDDNGQTWSKAVEITDQAKDESWTWYASGPCHAIQLSKGQYKGRIVVPCNHGVFEQRDYQGTASHLIYSDDHGTTWHIGGIADGGNESTVTELKNGTILLNMRGQRNSENKRNGYTRLSAVSRDGGETLGKTFRAKNLIEPICNGSILTFTKKGQATIKTLYSGPRDTLERKNMTICESRDGGRSWREVVSVTSGPAAYSDMVILPDGKVGILYETGNKFRYERIDFRAFSADRF